MKSYIATENCKCGKIHKAEIDDVVIGKSALNRLPEFIEKYNCRKAFLLADKNTFKAAGESVCNILSKSSISFSKHIYQHDIIEPDEYSIGSAIMHFDTDCDIIIGIGSGVINDVGKILSNVTNKKYIIVATAPSVDGYASSTSSMIVDNFKISLNSRCPDVIIGDTDILKNAPLHMLKSGIGDMIAKYPSIAEWRIANLILGEYYCEEVASLVRIALKKCVDNAEGLINRDEKAVEAVFEGLVISGLAMSYTGLSRPASGVEHYFSHIWDMRALEFGTKADLHGIQCATGTHIASKLYEKVKMIKPEKEKALNYVKNFSLDDWHKELKDFLGSGADKMIELEKTEGKYDKSTHEERFDTICKNWSEIITILNEELPSFKEIDDLLTLLDIPKNVEYLNMDKSTVQKTFKATADIRNKYILSRLAWDLGIIDSLCNEII